jgi:hypothetical protein
MEWQSHQQTSSGECTAPPARHWLCSPAASRDWSRRQHRRACMQLVRDQHIEMRLAEVPPSQSSPVPSPSILSRAQRAHFPLSWAERLTRNARAPAEEQASIKLFGVPDHFADFLGLRIA